MEKSRRRLGREKAVFAIYQWLLTDTSRKELEVFINISKKIKDDVAAKEFAFHLIDDCIENYASYRLDISKYLKEGWEFERLSYVERAILLVACSELKENNLDKKIIVNEAVELSKAFCDEQSYKFINGILKNINYA